MAERIEISVPDIGDFEDVEVVEILVAKGDEVEFDDPLVSVESDKATMEIPSTAAGVVAEIRVAEGDRVSEGRCSSCSKARLKRGRASPRKTRLRKIQRGDGGRRIASASVADPGRERGVGRPGDRGCGAVLSERARRGRHDVERAGSA